MHPNSVKNLETGTAPSPRTLKKLREIQSKLAAGTLEVSNKPQPARRVVKARRKRRVATAKPSNGSVDVVALRRKLGLSRADFARRVGAAPGRVTNWEAGKAASPRYLPKLRELAKSGEAGEDSVDGTREPATPRSFNTPFPSSRISLVDRGRPPGGVR
jgi:DNA-binding transcriptional regulator YiaG